FAPTVTDEIIDDSAALLEDEGILCAAHGDRAEVASERGIEERGRVGPDDPDLSHVREGKQSGRLSDRSVFSEPGTVFQRHIPAAKIGEGCAETFVLGV